MTRTFCASPLIPFSGSGFLIGMSAGLRDGLKKQCFGLLR